MGLLDDITAWFRRERADVGEAIDDLEDRVDDHLDRKERELTATPAERLEMIQEEIVDDPFASIRERIEQSATPAEDGSVDADETPTT
jgi:hypothetical protein